MLYEESARFQPCGLHLPTSLPFSPHPRARPAVPGVPVRALSRAPSGGSQTMFFYKAAQEYIQKTYPFWDRHAGRDHIWLWSWDEGACAAPAAIKNSILLSHWVGRETPLGRRFRGGAPRGPPDGGGRPEQAPRVPERARSTPCTDGHHQPALMAPTCTDGHHPPALGADGARAQQLHGLLGGHVVL